MNEDDTAQTRMNKGELDLYPLVCLDCNKEILEGKAFVAYGDYIYCKDCPGYYVGGVKTIKSCQEHIPISHTTIDGEKGFHCLHGCGDIVSLGWITNE